MGTPVEEAAAREYIKDAGYEVLGGCLYEKAAYRQAHNSGRAATETYYKNLNEQADILIQALIDRVGEENGGFV